MPKEKTLQSPWSHSADQVLSELGVDRKRGLDSSKVRERRKKYGSNRLEETKEKSVWKILINQFTNIIVLLLMIAAVLAVIFGNLVDGIAIVIAILLNAMIGFYMELKAMRSLESLKKLARVRATVIRNGNDKKITAVQLVPGDIILVSEGDIVAADIRLLESNNISADESALTGESVPVSKNIDALPQETEQARRNNMLYKGTVLTKGTGKGVVVATGTDTEIGKIKDLAESAEKEIAPIEKRLQKLAGNLVWLIIAIAAVVAITGVLAGKEMILLIETAIALAVAAVPEGLPIVATLALGRGMWRMAKKKALFKQLSAVETLGSVNTLLTDKTGTLTENKMTVTGYRLYEGEINVTGKGMETEGEFKKDEKTVDPDKNPLLKRALQVGVMCSNANLPEPGEDEDVIGEPMEVALLVCGRKAGIIRDELLDRYSEIREVAFDPEIKMMATIHEWQSAKYLMAVKGAPEAVLEVCDRIMTPDGPKKLDKKEEWLQKNQMMAEQGLRVLALAHKIVGDKDAEPYEALEFIGLVGFFDPPRPGVKETIRDFKTAGINLVLLTGDQKTTAEKVAESVGLFKEGEKEIAPGSDIKSPTEMNSDEKSRLVNIPVFVRCNPEQKLYLLSLHQEKGDVVAMTGDGINDAPALKKADIGIAMGKRGTQVAKESADLVLLDDALSTMVTAIRYGRVIFSNIRKFILYLLSGNVGEILTVGLAAALKWPLPLLPLQILYLNMINDVFPALALGIGPGHGGELERSPRKSEEPILSKIHWIWIMNYGLIIMAAILGSFQLAIHVLGLSPERAVTISFLTLSLSRLFHVLNMRDYSTTIFRNEIVKNPWIRAAVVICMALLFLALYVPFLADLFSLHPPSLQGWILILGMSILPTIAGQIWIGIKQKK